MKVVILAGGLGTRISEYSNLIPKPMIEIGGKPIISHIMNMYMNFGFNEFIIALGYKGEVIKEYFLNHSILNSDFKIQYPMGKITQINNIDRQMEVTLVDTGQNTMTGGRIKKLANVIGDSTFMLTYGDAVSDVNILDLVNFHKKKKLKATVTAVHPPARFGALEIGANQIVNSFKEKSQASEGWINGGFFVFEPSIFSYIDGDITELEKAPLEKLSEENELAAYQHYGFWQSMDTVRDKNILESIWNSDSIPWLYGEKTR
ncbi:MAG: glucose-1-phosphate cytidylyltransferase [Candidatus Hodarchaeota archaeon]